MLGHQFSGRPQVIQGNFEGRMPSFATASYAEAFASRQVAPHVQAAIQRNINPNHRRPAFHQQPVAQPRRQGNAFEVPRTFQFAPSVKGQRLPSAVQQKMEAFFAADFSDVRIHTGPQAQQIGARAFTMGSNIYFAPGQYMPHTSHGQRLIGHELTHVVQQRAGRVRNPFGRGVAVVQDPGMEAEADRMGLHAAAKPLIPAQAKRPPSLVQRRAPTQEPFSILQRALNPQGDPTDYLFIHHTISDYFTQGATEGSKGEHLDKVVADIGKGATDPLAFPPLPIFTIDDPNNMLGTETYSLSNRRLYVFKKSKTQLVNIRAATLQEVIDSLWKMTSSTGGYMYPKLTKFGNKEETPGGLLGQFRQDLETAIANAPLGTTPLAAATPVAVLYNFR